MQVALICRKCGKIHSDNDEATLVIDFKNGHMSFICMNKQCRYDNIFDFSDWFEKSKRSALPRPRMM
jgi:hypothetical protein